ncbi:MAG: 5-methylcytosine restriction system specificity protein McrC [Actinomycetota bacterium]
MPASLEVVQLIESRINPVTATVFRRLEASSQFWELVNEGVLSLVRSKDTPYGVRASAQVGQAILAGNLRLIVKEKSPGSLHALLYWSLPKGIREAEAPSPVGTDSPVLQTFASRFLDHLGNYLRHGRTKEYALRNEASSFPHGRVDVRNTAKLLSRGKRGVLAYRRTELTADTLPNRLLALGIIAVDAYSSVFPDGGTVRDVARLYAPLFEDVSRYDLLRAALHRKAAAFDLALNDLRVAGHLRKALEFARALVLHLGAWPETPSEQLPRSFFLNLELLFQDAVYEVVREQLPGMSVTKGRMLKKPIFDDLPDRYVADPDLVVGRPSAVDLVADCKYKVFKSWPEHSDVYQVLAHCAAIGCREGLLVYPGEACRMGKLGRSNSGVALGWATVRPQNLREDLIIVLGGIEPNGPLLPTEGRNGEQLEAQAGA